MKEPRSDSGRCFEISLCSMDLYLKAGPGGKEVGDCPFAQTVRIVLHIKRIDCKVRR